VQSTRVTRWVRASPAEVYRALLDPYAVAAWRVPNGMTATIHEFDAREGGRIRITLHHDAPGQPGKSGDRADTFAGKFTRLEPGRRVVESLEFEWLDPAYAGVMTLTTELREVDGGCEVTMLHEGIPAGVDVAANEVGQQMALVRLAAWVEDDRCW
jgi:uncharacterized protein YndB with AHSA1/START domain